jgi:hypothetical protein
MNPISNKDAAVCLAAIDQIEAKIKSGDKAGESEANQLLMSILLQPDGVMFTLQGVKAMLSWMMQGDRQEGGTRYFWGLVNEHGTQEQREAFNEFKSELYDRGDRLRDALMTAASTDSPLVSGRVAELMELICTIPTLEN